MKSCDVIYGWLLRVILAKTTPQDLLLFHLVMSAGGRDGSGDIVRTIKINSLKVFWIHPLLKH
jgi:hypothetical protein